MWSCPDCGRRFANANQSHACTDLTLEEHLGGHSEHAVALYAAVADALAACGPFRVHPQKTRVAFIAIMTFASVLLARRWVDLSLIVSTPVDDPRVRRIELYGPTSFAHTLRLREVADVDADVRTWLCAALARGRQETLDRDADVEPVVGHALEVLRVPLRSKVLAGLPEPCLALPRYAAEALAAAPGLVVRIAGREEAGRLADDRAAVLLAPGVVAGLGVGVGDEVDVLLAADL